MLCQIKISSSSSSAPLGPSRLRNDDVVGVDVDAAVELDHLVHPGDQVLDLRNDGTGRGDELVLVDRGAGVERRDQELAHALGTAEGNAVSM